MYEQRVYFLFLLMTTSIDLIQVILKRKKFDWIVVYLNWFWFLPLLKI